MKKVFAPQKTLRPAADFGFILPCRFTRQPACERKTAVA
jgi:hypothetical protein